jgi:hypothetical protein
MDAEQLRRFLLKSNAAGYASGNEKQWVRGVTAQGDPPGACYNGAELSPQLP